MSANTNQYSQKKLNQSSKEAGFARHIIHEVQRNGKLQKKISKIQKSFTPRPALEDKKSIYHVAIGFEWFFGILGVALGLYLMYSIFLDAFTISTVAITGALVFLGIWEYGKHVLLAGILREKYVYKRLNKWFLALNILMISCSMWWSVQGIINFNNEVIAEKPKITNITQVKKRHQQEISNLNKTSLLLYQQAEEKFSRRIQKIEHSTKNYLSRVTYKGNINVHNTANRTMITNGSNRITNIEQSQKSALEKIQQDKTHQLSTLVAAQKAELVEIQQYNQTTTQKTASKNENRYWNLLWLAFIGDLVCAIAVWYRVFHLYRGLKEIEEAEETTGAKIITPTLSIIRNTWKNNNEPPVPLTKKEAKIYKMYMQSNQNLTKAQMHKNTGISRTIIDQMFSKTGITYHRAQTKKLSSLPKEKSVQLAV